MAESTSTKRQHEENNSESDDEFVGPLPTNKNKKKERYVNLQNLILVFLGYLFLILFFLVLEFEDLYLDNLPNVEMYERSFMHRDIVTHLVTTK